MRNNQTTKLTLSAQYYSSEQHPPQEPDRLRTSLPTESNK